MRIKTQKEYKEMGDMLIANNEAVVKYCKDNKTNSIPSEVAKGFPYAEQVTNELRSAIERYRFKLEKPQSYFLYINEAKGIATTWTGEKLGKVYFGTKYKSNMGDVRIPIDVFGISGVKYHGMYFKSAGDYARIKAYKKQ